MKRNFFVIVLLLSILFWGVNATAFAQDQVKKDTVLHKVTKDVIKKGDVKKVEVKKEMTKTVETKKNGMKQEVTKKVETKTVIKDKEVGKTADGKIIYEGPRGGKYTISDKGKKVYIKKEVK
jgi:colicin import membrane protein